MLTNAEEILHVIPMRGATTQMDRTSALVSLDTEEMEFSAQVNFFKVLSSFKHDQLSGFLIKLV